MRHLRVVAFAAFSLFASGCVEGEVEYTLNPDSSGKAKIDLILPSTLAGFRGAEATPDQMARELVAHELTRGRGITGWSDVSGEFLRDGRFRFRATAYFQKLADVDLEAFAELQLVREADGSLKLLPKKKEERLGKKKEPLPDFAKMTDAQWDQFLLRKRIEAQAMKPLLVSVLADAKVKITIHLPGEITAVKVCKEAGKKAVTLEIDGNSAIKEFRRILSLSDGELRKLYQDGKGPGFDEDSSLNAFLLGGEPSVTVAKPTGPAFNYKKEVAAAVAGNAELRRKFQIPAFQKLPGDPGATPSPKLKFPPPPPPPPPPPKPKD